jgi:hypothetical protein
VLHWELPKIIARQISITLLANARDNCGHNKLTDCQEVLILGDHAKSVLFIVQIPLVLFVHLMLHT